MMLAPVSTKLLYPSRQLAASAGHLRNMLTDWGKFIIPIVDEEDDHERCLEVYHPLSKILATEAHVTDIR